MRTREAAIPDCVSQLVSYPLFPGLPGFPGKFLNADYKTKLSCNVTRLQHTRLHGHLAERPILAEGWAS